MNVREILLSWLKENGYDGLCNPEKECSCMGYYDLLLCVDFEECQPGYLVKDTPEGMEYLIKPEKDEVD